MDDENPISRRVFGVISAACIALLVLFSAVKFSALWPYQLMRWGMCAAALISLSHVSGFRIVLAVLVAVVYNPIDPIAFGSAWPKINLATAAIWLMLFPWSPKLQASVRAFWKWFSTPGRGEDGLAHLGAMLVMICLTFSCIVLIWAGCTNKDTDDSGPQKAPAFYLRRQDEPSPWAIPTMPDGLLEKYRDNDQAR